MTNLSVPKQLDDGISMLSNEYLKHIIFDAMDITQMNKYIYNPAVVAKLFYPNNKTMQAQYKYYEL
eukprot:6242515-Ditylum_brightwellii.AAC.1